jgi:ribosome biogenesis GTPase / thiamine phosphate phosphatase
MKGRIYRIGKKEFEVVLSGSTERLKVKALGNLLREGPVVGDYVELNQDEHGEHFIEKIHPRGSEIFRIIIRSNQKKVTAANVDRLVIVSSVSQPLYKRGIIDRFMVRACQWGIRPMIVFNKMDQFDPASLDIKFEEQRLKELGADCYEISAHLKEDYLPQYFEKGWKELVSDLKGKTAIFLGKSGVGKSRTISSLSGEELKLKTKEVRKIGKGSHTTTWSELVDFPDFSLIDSPGIRTFSLEDINPDVLLEYFPDLEERSLKCKFGDCGHVENSKGCIFFYNDWDELTRKCLLSRLESFHQIHEEIGRTPEWNKSF